MKKIVSVVLSVVAMTFLASCGGDAAASAAGKYALDKAALEELMKAEMPADAPKEGPAAEAAMKMMQEMMKGFDGSIELKADNTFTMSMTMMGQKQDATGTWKLDGDKLSMTAKVDGKDDTKEAKFADGVISIEEKNGDKTMSMKFKKAE